MIGPVLLWYPGAQVSVFDVARGLGDGLAAHGVSVVPYRTDGHLNTAAQYLDTAYRQRVDEGQDVPKPTFADIVYQANMGVLERALRYDVEWIVSVSGLYQHPDYFLMLRRAGRRVALVATESPYNIGGELALAKIADHVFVTERSAVPLFRSVTERVTYLPHAYHPGLHVPEAETPEINVASHDVVFVGTGWIERVRLIESMDWSGLDFGLYGSWSLADDHSPLRAHLRGTETPNAKTAALYRQATVGLNLHRTSVEYDTETRHIKRAQSINPRCYELAACGVPFVTDWRPELDDVFGGAVPTFRTAHEAEAVLRRAVREASWRADHAARAREAVMPHSWTARAAGVVAALDGHMVAVAA